jgi:hypothetical protein
MSVFEYSFFLLVGFIPIYNLVCVILNNNQNDFDKLNIKINMLIYSNEQLKTKIENIISKTISKTKMDASVAMEESPLESSPVVEESRPVVEETPAVSVVEDSPLESSHVVEETPSSSIIDTSIDDDSDIDFVQDRVKNDKASQNLSYFISSKLTNISSNFF